MIITTAAYLRTFEKQNCKKWKITINLEANAHSLAQLLPNKPQALVLETVTGGPTS